MCVYVTRNVSPQATNHQDIRGMRDRAKTYLLKAILYLVLAKPRGQRVELHQIWWNVSLHQVTIVLH